MNADIKPQKIISREQSLENRIVRLNKIIKALMDRAERSMSLQGSEFGMFQTAIMLEDKVRLRTAELESALSENERITRALRESEKKFHNLANQSLVGIAIINDERQISYSNEKFNEIFDYSEQEMANLDPILLVAEHDKATVCEILTGEGDQSIHVIEALRRDGRHIFVELHSSHMLVNEKSSMINLVIDVTERVRSERELKLLHEELRKKSIHDALTGLYNRHYLESALDSELKRAKKNNCELSIIMGDIDHFKFINDQFGHLAGDEVLRFLGELLKQCASETEIDCRYGGEEFLLVLPNTDKKTALKRAELLRKKIEDLVIMHYDNKITFTISFGVATFPQQGTTPEKLINAADVALYRAKIEGRNRVCD